MILTPEQVAAIADRASFLPLDPVDDIPSLAASHEALRAERDRLDAHIEALRDAVIDAALVDVARARARGVAEERARIVAWLRAVGDHDYAGRYFADVIEREDHAESKP